MNVQLVIIDPQVDFMDDPGNMMGVPGANDDMDRLGVMIKRIMRKVDDIHVTMDSHNTIDIGHPGMWKDKNGNAPAPFTPISSDDLKNDIWTPRDPTLRAYFIDYSEKLEAQGNYPMMVWPEHCIIGSPGWNVQANLLAALNGWERETFSNIDYVSKGTDAFREHYGALMAEVVDPSVPSSGLNTKFVENVATADIIGVGGEASSHCVLSTINQFADNIGDEHLSKFHILTDCMSAIPQVGTGPDFPALTKQGFEALEKRGMILTTSDKFLA